MPYNILSPLFLLFSLFIFTAITFIIIIIDITVIIITIIIIIFFSLLSALLQYHYYYYSIIIIILIIMTVCLPTFSASIVSQIAKIALEFQNYSTSAFVIL